MVCKRCKKDVLAEKYCSNCGAKLDSTTEYKDIDNKTQKIKDNVIYEDVVIDTFIGPNSAAIKKGKFSFFAFLFGPLYYFYRKMALEGTVLLLISLFLGIVLDESSYAINLCLSLYMGFTFKSHYLKFVQNKINEIKIQNPYIDIVTLKLLAHQRGGVSFAPVIFIIAIYGLLFTVLIEFLLVANIIDERIEETPEYPMSKKLVYTIPEGFYQTYIELEGAQNYETTNGMCYFTVITEPTDIDNSIEKLSNTYEPHVETGFVTINGASWMYEYDYGIETTQYNLSYSNTENYTHNVVNFHMTNDPDHAYCSDSYEVLKNSLRFK